MKTIEDFIQKWIGYIPADKLYAVESDLKSLIESGISKSIPQPDQLPAVGETIPSREDAESMGTLKRLQDYPFYDEQYLDGWMECYDWLVKQIPTLPLTAQQFADEPVSAEIAHTETDVKIPIWTNECPECDGIVTLYEKGGIASCDSCTREFTTDYEEHPELDQSQTEYWLVDVYIPKPIRNDSFSSKLRSKIFADELTERWVNIESKGTLKFFDWLKSELLKPQEVKP